MCWAFGSFKKYNLIYMANKFTKKKKSDTERHRKLMMKTVLPHYQSQRIKALSFGRSNFTLRNRTWPAQSASVYLHHRWVQAVFENSQTALLLQAKSREAATTPHWTFLWPTGVKIIIRTRHSNSNFQLTKLHVSVSQATTQHFKTFILPPDLLSLWDMKR